MKELGTSSTFFLNAGDNPELFISQRLANLASDSACPAGLLACRRTIRRRAPRKRRKILLKEDDNEDYYVRTLHKVLTFLLQFLL